MDKDHIAYLRGHAHALVALARTIKEHAVAGELEAMAVELLERARALENSDSLSNATDSLGPSAVD
jgi:hypothetical protein